MEYIVLMMEPESFHDEWVALAENRCHMIHDEDQCIAMVIAQ